MVLSSMWLFLHQESHRSRIAYFSHLVNMLANIKIRVMKLPRKIYTRDSLPENLRIVSGAYLITQLLDRVFCIKFEKIL